MNTSSRVDKNKYNQKRGRTNSTFGNSTALAPFGVESMLEIWKDLPEYEGLYMVSNIGTVKSMARMVKIGGGGFRPVSTKILKHRISTCGYKIVNLSIKNNLKTFEVHKLVAIAFLGHSPCGGKIVVDHINNVRTDNNVRNLQLISQRENASKHTRVCSIKYTGVTWLKRECRWASRIRINGKLKSLGSFNDEIEAHKAYLKELNIVNERIK